MITCCNGCKPPERNAYCHTYCEKYIKAKEKHDLERDAILKKKDVQARLDAQAMDGMQRVYKIQRKFKGR